MGTSFRQKLNQSWADGRFTCVGLDVVPESLPDDIRGFTPVDAMRQANRIIVDATIDLAGSYKPNTAFYERYGAAGLDVLHDTVAYIHEQRPEVPVLLDAKRGDIGNTNDGYLNLLVEWIGADAITVHPYMGAESLRPFLDRADIGVFVLCRTSNPGAGEFQDLLVGGEPLYLHMARAITDSWNDNGNCGLVVGATVPDELSMVRAVSGDLPILIPGIGAQGGDLGATVAAIRETGEPTMMISASRAINHPESDAPYPEAVRAAAEQLHLAILAELD